LAAYDNYMDLSYAGNQKDLTDRPRLVSVVLSYMLTTWIQHDRLDAARVGMFGFSLGGFTTLVETGGIPDVNRMRELCTKHPTAPECLFIKQRNGDQLKPEALTPVWTHDQRVKAAVVAAPAVSYLFGPGSLKDVEVPIQLWRASSDDQVPDAWNTAVIPQELPKPPGEHVVTGAGHYAFLPPCSEALAKLNKHRRSAATIRPSTGMRFIAISTEKSLHSSRKRLLHSAYRSDCEVNAWITLVLF
jgi:predicted dienelactone hydrolase